MRKERLKVKCLGVDESGKGIVRIKGKEYYLSNFLEGETGIVEVFQNRNGSTVRLIKIEEDRKSVV